MSNKWVPPKVSPPDAEGFLTFSFYTADEGETLRVSFNPGKHREYLAKTGSDTDFVMAEAIIRDSDSEG